MSGADERLAPRPACTNPQNESLTAPQPIDLATIALRRTPGAPVAQQHKVERIAFFGWGTVIDEAGHRDRGSDPFRN